MTQRVVNYTYGTGNPVLPDGSIDVRDGIDNLQSLDVLMNAPEDTYNQRDGNIVSTVAGANKRFDAQIINMGFTRVGTFAAGATLTNPRQTLLWDIADGGDGQEYGWSGSFPKVVPAASTPASTGGISVGAWISRFDPELRIQVREALRRSYAEAGYNLVGGSFEAGGVLVNANDALLQESTGKAFSGPAGTVAAGTNPTSGGFVDVSTSGLIPMLYAGIRAYNGATKEIRCIGKDNVFDGRFGIFVRDDADITSTDDGITVLVDASGRRWKRQFSGALLPRFAGVVGDGVIDDYAACADLIAAFKKRGTPAPGGIDMSGDGIDWTGYKCRLSQKLDLTGLFNYNFTNPTFAAHSSFSGTALLKIDSDHTYLVSGITWINPQLDGAWLADYCVEAYDFLKWSLIGGKFTHYKKKGFITGTVHDAPHEINALGTFFFQREYNETYPPSVTEGEAFFVDNYDNEFTNIVVGYHKQWAFTLNKGANRFVGGHVYTGWNSDPAIGGVRSLDNGDDFIGTYFDNTWVKMNARFSCNGCQFLVGTATGAVAAILDSDPYQVKITDCRFKKLGANTQVISMPTVSAGRTSRPDIYDNEYENCSGITTRGAWFTGLNVSSLVVQVPDSFLPLGNFSMPGRAASATGALADRMCGASYDAVTNNMTINTYKILPDGTITPSVLNGSMVMNMNV